MRVYVSQYCITKPMPALITRRYGRSAIRMLFCKISEHILDEILISGKVQIIVSADYVMFGRN